MNIKSMKRSIVTRLWTITRIQSGHDKLESVKCAQFMVGPLAGSKQTILLPCSYDKGHSGLSRSNERHPDIRREQMAPGVLCGSNSPQN